MERCKTCRHWFEDSKIGAMDETRLCVWLTGMKGERVAPLSAGGSAHSIRTRPDFGCTCHEERPKLNTK